MRKKLFERYMKNNCKRKIKQSLQLKKQSKEMVKNYIFRGNDMKIYSITGLIKNTSWYKMIFFSEPYARSKKNKIVLDFPNYTTKSDATVRFSKLKIRYL